VRRTNLADFRRVTIVHLLEVGSKCAGIQDIFVALAETSECSRYENNEQNERTCSSNGEPKRMFSLIVSGEDVSRGIAHRFEDALDSNQGC